MANVQLVRQRDTQRNPITMTKVDQAQSLQLVQTMLHGAMSTLTYSRGLFPTKAFKVCFYDSQDTTIPYETFAKGALPTLKAEAMSPSTKVPVLMRQQSRRADRFLDWLEKGVFQEIESGKLRAVQIFIHPHHELRHQVLETYTFTVHYTTKGNGRRAPSGLTASTSGEETATMEATNIALQQLLRKLAQTCEDLPILPAKRMLSMGLVYEGRLSRVTPVAGFGPDEGGDLSFPTIEGWRVATESCELASGHHSSHLKITGLQPDQEHLDISQVSQLPKDLRFALNTSRYDDVLSMPPPVTLPRPQSNSKRARENTSKRSSQQAGHIRDSSVSGIDGNLEASREQVNGKEEPTRSILTRRMNSEIGRMMQPEQITQGDTQTQGNYFAPTTTFEDEDLVTATPTTVHTPSTRAARKSSNTNEGAFSLLPRKRRDLMQRKKHLTKTAREIAEKAGALTQTGQYVLCQCGFGGEEGDMVQCSVCDTWQHLHCCGYVGENDPRLPEDHYCYCCLVDDTDALRAIQELAIERRALFYVFHFGMRSKADMTNVLGLSKQKGTDLHNMIVGGKFVEAAVNSHKPGYRVTGKALWVPVQDKGKLREMLDMYFDPMTAVSQHYELPSGDARVGSIAADINVQSLLAMRADLPEPVTRRVKSGERTPMSSSEQPTSETLVAPVSDALVNASASRSLKRKAATEGVEVATFATPSTTRQNFSSLKSLMVIDAGGNSSPLSGQGSVQKSRKSRR